MKQPLLFDMPNRRRRRADASPGVANRNEVYHNVIAPKLTQAQLRVLDVLSRLPSGATIDETARLMGKSAHQISVRFSELRKQGKIATNGEKRITASGNPAVVWFATGTGEKP